MVSGYCKYRLVLTFGNTKFCPQRVFYVLHGSEKKTAIILSI